MCAARVKNRTCTRRAADSSLDAHSKESLRSLAGTLYTHEQCCTYIRELLSPGRRRSFLVTLSAILHVVVYLFIDLFHSWLIFTFFSLLPGNLLLFFVFFCYLTEFYKPNLIFLLVY